MWITTVNIDLVAVGTLTSQERADIFDSISNKRTELGADPSVGGNGVPGFEKPEFDTIGPMDTLIVVKRSWNVESVAQEFTDHVNSLHSGISATLEQV